MRFFGLALLLLLALPAQAQRDRIQPTDLFQIAQLGDVEVSPSGRYAVYTVKSIVEEDGERRYRTHLWMVEVGREGSARPLTQGDASASSPAWAPDGSAIAFVRSVEGTPQVFWLPLDGGEAVQLTEMPYGATGPQVSPTGDRVLVQSRLPYAAVDSVTRSAPPFPTERPGRYSASGEPDADGSAQAIRAFLDQNAREGTAEVTNRLRFQGEQGLDPDLHFTHLYTVPASAVGAPHEPDALTSGWGSYANGQWMPDGQNLVADGYAGAVHPDRADERHLYSLRVGGSAQRLLRLDDYRTSRPQISPDGSTVAFFASRLDDPGYAQTEVGLLALDGTNEVTWLTDDFDRSVQQARFGPDGWYLYLVAAADGGFPLYRVPTGAAPPEGLTMDGVAERLDIVQRGTADSLLATLDPAERDRRAALADSLAGLAETGPVRLTAPTAGVRSFDVGRSGIAYVVTTPENPYELALANVEGQNPRVLTRHNAGWLEGKRLAPMQQRTLTRLLPREPDTLRLDTLSARALLADSLALDSLGRGFSDLTRLLQAALAADTTGQLALGQDQAGADTLEVDYWVMEPVGRQRNRRYPLLVQMHGGPSAMWGPGEATMWHEFQLFAARGYGVVFANPRGSGGYGYEFQRANYQDWGAGPASDVLAVTDEAMRLPWVDADRLALTGGSYAGYLTAWIVAHDDRFQAAVAQRGVYDLQTFFGEGNAFRLVETHFGGFPWEEEADSVLTANSPITFADQITTPLLILHASQDLRTGVSQSEQLYRTLKVLERPVEYARYPGAGHDLSRTGDPAQRLDRLLRIYEFVERFTGR
jgi:dipeptidyl aminopeptidase/acylaminoacyl peptidase